MIDTSALKVMESILQGGKAVGLTPWVRMWGTCALDGCGKAIAGFRAAQTGKDQGVEYACIAGHRFVDYWEPQEQVSA